MYLNYRTIDENSLFLFMLQIILREFKKKDNTGRNQITENETLPREEIMIQYKLRIRPY